MTGPGGRGLPADLELLLLAIIRKRPISGLFLISLYNVSVTAPYSYEGADVMDIFIQKEPVSLLVVVAHPDDEVLGCGGTLANLSLAGLSAQACILVGDADARVNRPGLSDFHRDIHQVQGILGVKPPLLGRFPNLRLNMVAHVELVQFIEKAIEESGANLIFTHHPGDLNNDHLQTSMACQAAARLFQRRPHIPHLQGLYFMEVPSSTDWAFPSNGAFRADTFVELGKAALDLKIKALEAYKGVMRDFPHPRSAEVLRGLAACRGAQAGMNYAEAFECAFAALTF